MTRREVASRTGPFPLRTREMVATETPAFLATSLIVTLRWGSRINVNGYIGAYATAQGRACQTFVAKIFYVCKTGQSGRNGALCWTYTDRRRRNGHWINAAS